MRKTVLQILAIIKALDIITALRVVPVLQLECCGVFCYVLLSLLLFGLVVFSSATPAPY